MLISMRSNDIRDCSISSTISEIIGCGALSVSVSVSLGRRIPTIWRRLSRVRWPCPIAPVSSSRACSGLLVMSVLDALAWMSMPVRW